MTWNDIFLCNWLSRFYQWDDWSWTCILIRLTVALIDVFFDTFFTAHSQDTAGNSRPAYISYAVRTFDDRLKQPSKTPIQVVLSLIWSRASTSLLLKNNTQMSTQHEPWQICLTNAYNLKKNMNNWLMHIHDSFILSIFNTRLTCQVSSFLYLYTSCGSSVFHELAAKIRTWCPTIDFPYS